MFRKKTKENKIFFHEDEYLQIELLPIENYEFCCEQTGDIQHFADEHTDGIGYTDIFQRSDEKVSLESKELSLSKVKSILEIHLNYFPNIETGYGSSEKSASNTIGYGFDNLQILINFTDDHIRNIWIRGFVSNEDEVSSLLEALFRLGQLYDLIIADWEGCHVVQLKSRAVVKEYINTFI